MDEVADVAPSPAVGRDHRHCAAEQPGILLQPQLAEFVGGEQPALRRAWAACSKRVSIA